MLKSVVLRIGPILILNSVLFSSVQQVQLTKLVEKFETRFTSVQSQSNNNGPVTTQTINRPKSPLQNEQDQPL
jgi:hypothetical protein